VSEIVKEISRLAKHSAIYGLSNVLGKAIGFLLIPLYTHYIHPADYGILELLDLSVNIIGMFVGMGLSSAVAKFYYDYSDLESRRKVVSSALFTMAFLSGVMVLLCWPFSSLIAGRVLGSETLSSYVRISLVTFALNSVLEIPLTYIRAREQSLFYCIVALIRLAVSLGLNIYFIVFLHLGILGILYSGLIVSTLVSVYLVFWCIRDAGICLDFKMAKAMILFGAPLILNSLGMFVINFGDRFVLKSTASLADVGVYSLGYKIGMGMMSFLVGQPFFLIWSVRRYGLVKEENGLDKYGQVFLFYMLLLLVLWLGLCAFSQEMMLVLAPPEYRGAGIIMPLIALGYLFREMSDFFRGAFMIKNKTHMIGTITIVVSIYCVINYLIFIPLYHGMGAAIATVSTFVFMALINGYFAVRIMPLNYNLKRIFILLIVFLLLGGVCTIISCEYFSVVVVISKVVLFVMGCSIAPFIVFKLEERDFIFKLFAVKFVKK